MADLPNSVRYIKNGRKGSWWSEAKANGQLHAGWQEVPPSLLKEPHFPAIKRVLEKYWKQRNAKPGTVTQDFNALRTLLDHPSQHVWITYEDGSMWWCTVKDGAEVNPEGQSQTKGTFWLRCNKPWSNQSLGGQLLTITDLPGDVTLTQGFRATVGKPKYEVQILRVIRDERDPDVIASSKARKDYEDRIKRVITRLSWKDFELLINLILERSGWVRLSRVGGTSEGIDLDVANWAIGERAFVQVKAAADQQVLNSYIEDFERRPQYDRMIFAVHSPPANGLVSSSDEVHVWATEQISHLVVRLGLGEWVESKLA
jgi:hypothetical protein